MTEPISPLLRESLQRFKTILSKEDMQHLLEIQDTPLPTGIRLNPLKVTPEKHMSQLAQRYGWKTIPIPFCDHSWLISQAETAPGTTIEHRMGTYYLQDAASMVPVSLFDTSNPSPLILDMAASPGGKTTHLINQSMDQGFVIANDASKSRLAALRTVLSNWGGINQIVTNYPGESFGSWFPETFDLVLLDAPCTMENLRPTPNHPLRETTTDERGRLQQRQIDLLKSGLRALKTGGQLVYATCSLAPEEDEAVIDAVLRQFPGQIKLLDFPSKIPFNLPGLTQFNQMTFSSDLSKALRLWPHLTGMSGFFCALLTKVSPMAGDSTTAPERDFDMTGLGRLDEKQTRQIITQIEDHFGTTWHALLGASQPVLMQRHDDIHLIPRQYLFQFHQLPYNYIGMPLGRLINERLEPSHAFISRFGMHFSQHVLTLAPEEARLWIKGRDIRHPQTEMPAEGQYVLVRDQDGRDLGLGKHLPKRLRNMLPKGLI